MTNQLISPKQLEEIFETRRANYVNPNDVEIDLIGEVDCRMRVWHKGPLSLDLNTELSTQDFISNFSISTAADLDTIEEKDLWQLYQKGKGQVWATLFDEGPELSFEIINGITIIEAFQLPYKDQINEIWDSTAPFRTYISNNIQKIYHSAEQGAEK